jgi:hypothetical protein
MKAHAFADAVEGSDFLRVVLRGRVIDQHPDHEGQKPATR